MTSTESSAAARFSSSARGSDGMKRLEQQRFVQGRGSNADHRDADRPSDEELASSMDNE